MYSQSPITKKSYEIPDEGAKDSIKKFLDHNAKNKVVVVQGLGFVGYAMALVVANAKTNYAVIGVDLPNEDSFWKVASINDGELPLTSSDKKLVDYSKNAQRRGNFYATHDEYAYQVADVIIIDINLDVEKSSSEQKRLNGYTVDLSSFTNSIARVIENCKQDALILLESTVPPGFCSKIILPLAEKIFLERGLRVENLKIAHSYERVMPGPDYIDSIENFYRVYSGTNEKSAKAAEKFLRTVIRTDKYPLTRLSCTTASELSKVLENSYRAMNIAFMQEWTEFADASGVDLYEVIEAIRLRPTHQNIMQPGLGVGGYCLTKDPLLASWAAQSLFGSSPLFQSERAVAINDQMPLYSVGVLQKFFGEQIIGKSVLVMGVSYRNDVGDTRNSPVELLYDELLSSGARIVLHDPYVAFWQEKKISIACQIEDLEVNSLDVVIIAAAHQAFLSQRYIRFINNLKPKLMLDTVGCFRNIASKFDGVEDLRFIGKG